MFDSHTSAHDDNAAASTELGYRDLSPSPTRAMQTYCSVTALPEATMGNRFVRIVGDDQDLLFHPASEPRDATKLLYRTSIGEGEFIALVLSPDMRIGSNWNVVFCFNKFQTSSQFCVASVHFSCLLPLDVCDDAVIETIPTPLIAFANDPFTFKELEHLKRKEEANVKVTQSVLPSAKQVGNTFGAGPVGHVSSPPKVSSVKPTSSVGLHYGVAAAAAPKTTGFGNPAHVGFGAKPTGFGSQHTGGFGAPRVTTGFGAKQTGFGSPHAGGFGAPVVVFNQR